MNGKSVIFLMTFFFHVAMNIGFKDDIPDDFQTADGFATDMLVCL